MCQQPNLGCATTRELITEVAARIEMHTYVGGDGHKVQRLLKEIALLRLDMLDVGLNPDYRTIDEEM